MDNINLIKLECVDSTCTFARENAVNLDTPSLVVANKQTAGRGRHGKSFYSPENTGLYMTLLIETTPQKAERLPLFTPAAAVAVCMATEKNTGISPQIKWVNDVFVGGKKCCGILTERFVVENRLFTSVGIGINLNTQIFPEDISSVACSLGTDCCKEKLALDIAAFLLDHCEKENNEFVLTEYRKRLFILGEKISYVKNSIEYSAVATDINELCNLCVVKENGETDVLSSGEISIKF